MIYCKDMIERGAIDACDDLFYTRIFLVAQYFPFFFSLLLFMVILYSNGNNNKISLIDEPHPFDLTWRNYLPSFSQFCCCFQRQQNIRLEEDSLYQGEALQNYLDNPVDWEFETILGQNKRRYKKKKRTLDLENVYYEDADFLADDQIHNLVYKVKKEKEKREQLLSKDAIRNL